jgi:hypothetical protein
VRARARARACVYLYIASLELKSLYKLSGEQNASTFPKTSLKQEDELLSPANIKFLSITVFKEKKFVCKI